MREENIIHQIIQTEGCSFHVYAVREIVFDGIPSLVCDIETHHGYDVDYLQITLPQNSLAECLLNRGDIEHYNRHAVKWTNGDTWSLRRLYSVGAQEWIEDAIAWHVKELAEHLAKNKNGNNVTLKMEAAAWKV